MNQPAFTINRLRVDPQPIADGLYQMICEQGDEAIVAFGMIPLPIIEMCERLIRERAIAECARQLQCTPQELAPFLDEQKIRDTIAPIIRAISIGIFQAASNAGNMRN